MTKQTDDKNPQFLFNQTDTELLVAVANGSLDAVQLARQQLANRGLNQHGVWVGFDVAKEIWLLSSSEGVH